VLDRQLFLSVVDSVPLVAIDLVLVRQSQEVLLGLRKNRPAQGYWFVPGGRIFKNETVNDALIRVAESELRMGEQVRSGQLSPQFIGHFEHFYPDCFAGECMVSTHYVVLAYRVEVSTDFELPLADDQHSAFGWWNIIDALQSPLVHQYTKDYLSNRLDA
jgi:colanic acid biosynthesis protein WcaH